ncbi:cysteine--tRNA ligase [Nanoarchaeota archaeon]
MSLKLFNTLGRELQEFETIKDGQVGLYSCGPTVYWYQHIGNLRSYIFADLLKRVLKFNGYKITHVMNVTDVGHLTSDADVGEDKIEEAAKKEGKSAAEIAEHYLSVFKKDLVKLNILSPSIWCKATEHINEQIELIRLLEENGFTYKTSDGIYFDSSKLDDYGKLFVQAPTLKDGIKKGLKKGLKDGLGGLEAGKRVSMGEKKNKTDFALWKFSEEPGKRQQEWDSPWGIGFPGWHIECSAMSSKYLGHQFEIHTGGEDHISVHHTNEIAQSEAAFGKKPWVKYWLHGAFLTFKGEKVSKSKGGLYTIAELEEQGYIPLDFRYLCLLTHYRKQLDFSLKTLDAAKNAHERLKNKIIELKKEENSKGSSEKYEDGFEKAVNDDLNIPKAVGIMWDLLKDEKIGSKEKLELAFKFDEILGLGLKDVEEEVVDVSKEVEKLIQKREDARVAKDFEAADKIRDDLKKKGIILEDTSEGVKWKKT